MGLFSYIGSSLYFGYTILQRFFTPPIPGADLVLVQVALLVRRCMLPVCVVVFTVGAVISLQASNLFSLVSAEPLLGGISALFTFREIGPVLAGVMIAAQGGTSVSTEVGAMKIRQELEALELMATDPIKYAIGPRFIAFVFSVPVLTLMANLFGVLGAFLVAIATTNTTPYSFLESVLSYITMLDIWIGMIKAVAFGLATGCIACYNGYRVEGGAAQVGQAANQSVVYSIIALLVLNYCITTIVFGTNAGIQKF